MPCFRYVSVVIANRQTSLACSRLSHRRSILAALMPLSLGITLFVDVPQCVLFQPETLPVLELHFDIPFGECGCIGRDFGRDAQKLQICLCQLNAIAVASPSGNRDPLVGLALSDNLKHPVIRALTFLREQFHRITDCMVIGTTGYQDAN